MPRVTITVPDKMPQPYRFPLDRQVVTIWRGSESDIAIDCGSISVRHAEMLRIEGGYELRDLGSTNGIKLDGQRSDTIGLRHGATVRLGDVAFDFQLSEEERDALRREKVLDDLPLSREPETVASSETAVTEHEVEAQPHKRAVAPSGSGKGWLVGAQRQASLSSVAVGCVCCLTTMIFTNQLNSFSTNTTFDYQRWQARLI